MLECVIYNDVDFDELGFQPPGRPSSKVLWGDIVRVAYCYEIHPVVIADWGYWAFQTGSPHQSPWVEIDPASVPSLRFADEIYRRFGKPEMPPMKDWADSFEYCIRTFVIYPAADFGKPLYVAKKKHWWSSSGRLSFAQP